MKKYNCYLPYMWAGGERASDGLGGLPPEDAGTIYVTGMNEDTGIDAKVVLQTTIRDLVEDVIDPMKSYATGKIDDTENLKVISKIKESFLEAIHIIDENCA